MDGIEDAAFQAASAALSDILGDENPMKFAASYCPATTRETLSGLGVMPGFIGRELLEESHETSMGTMADPVSLILHAARLGIADIATLIISSEFQDVLLGTPGPVHSKIAWNKCCRLLLHRERGADETRHTFSRQYPSAGTDDSNRTC